MTKSPEEPPRESIAPTKSTLIGVSAPTFPRFEQEPAPSSKSTLIGLSAPTLPPASAAPGGSAKSTLIGLTPPSLPPPTTEAAPAARSTPADATSSVAPSPREESEARAALPAGAVFDGRYRVERVLARGRVGTVYAVQSVEHGVARALKVLKVGARDSRVADERVLDDLSLVESVVSEHVAAVYESGCTEGGAVWFAAELLDGSTLAQRAADTSRDAITRSEAWTVLRHVALGLDAAHAKGLVHRDLRPSNVLLETRRGGGVQAKLLDFGVSHRVEWERARGGPDVGAEWVAPECVEGASVTPGADFWSFGLLAFWLFTGRSYWPTGRVRLDAPIVLASERCAELAIARRLPDGFDAWFEQCVARSPRDRFRTARDLSVELINMLHASRAHPPSASSTADATPDPTPPSATTEAPIIRDDDPRVISIETRMTADEARATAEAMRATRDPQRVSIPVERPAPSNAPAAPPRTAITAPFPVVKAADLASEDVDDSVSAVLRRSILDAAPSAPIDPPEGRNAVPLVPTRRLSSMHPSARTAKLAAALLGGACAVFGVAWFVATSERDTDRPEAQTAVRVSPPRDALAIAPDAAIRVAPTVAPPAETPAPRPATDPIVATTQPPSESASPRAMTGWRDGSVRVWTGDLEVRRTHLPFTLALRRHHRFSVAGYFAWSLRDAQVRENLIGTYDPSAMLMRVHGTTSSDPLRMPVGAYALRLSRNGDLVGSTMVRSSRLTASLDADAAARVSTFQLPDASDADAGAPARNGVTP